MIVHYVMMILHYVMMKVHNVMMIVHYVIHLYFFSYIACNTRNTQQFDCWSKTNPSRCITVVLTGQQFIDLLSAIKLLTDGLIFIGSTSHVILTSVVFSSKGEMVSSWFANMSDEEMEKLVENTKNAIYVAWKVFEHYIVVKNSHKAQLSTRYVDR